MLAPGIQSRQLQDMSIEKLRQRLEEFRPFTLQLSSGKSYHVPHRDFIAVHPKMIVVIDAKGISHTISPLHVVAISEEEAAD
jgi:hypothetical protein